MNPASLPRIPSPPQHYWRQFRIKALPFVTFAGVLVLAIWLWGNNLASPLITGQAEGLQTDITSPVAGRVAVVSANLYQEVQTGDIIAQVDASDPQVLTNTISVIRARMNAIHAGAGFNAGDRVRMAQFQMDWLTRRSELVSLRAGQQYSEAELARIENLSKEGVSSQAELDVAKRDVEKLDREVHEKAKAVAAAEQSLQKLDPDTANGESASVLAELAVAAEELRLAEAQLQPIILRAPISGYLTKLQVTPQSTVVRGGAIATIANAKVNRIVGYLPQPVSIEPKVGMKIEVRSRGHNRQVAQSQIAHVGPRIELFDAPLRVRGMGAAQERGLPIVVSVPPDMNLRPGELVDIRLLNQDMP